MGKKKDRKNNKKSDNLTMDMVVNQSLDMNPNQSHNTKMEALGPNTKR